MLKGIQTKIVMVFMILGIIIITSVGIIFLYRLNSIENIFLNDKVTLQDMTSQIEKTKIIIYCCLGGFVIITCVLGIFISKMIISPISRLIKSAETVTKENNSEKYLEKKDKNKNELDNLANTFIIMNNELKENLNEATRQKKQMETILLHMTDGIIAFNIDGKIIHINPAARTFLELKDEHNFEEIFSKFNVDINLEKIIYLENWTSSEQKVKVGNRYINMFFAPYKDENDRPAGMIVVIQDITEHVRLDNMRKEFVADVSHELKTPITSIMGYADTLLEGEYEKEIQDKFLNVIASEARRMAKLVSDLLTLSRYDNSQAKIEKTEFDLGELVKYTFEGLDLEMKKKNHSAECFVTSNVPLVYADRSGVERVVLNILTNSIKYTKENGTIKVYVGFVYNDAYIKIIDNGIGIPEEDLNKIFERFYRVDKARTREMGGTGLRSFNCKRNFRPE